MIPYARRLAELNAAAAEPVATPAPADRSGIAHKVLALLEEVLQVPPGSLDPEASLAGQGLSSLLAVRLLDRINRAFDLRLGVETLFTFATPARLAAHVAALAPSPPSQPAPSPVRLVAPAAREPAPMPAAMPIAITGMAGRFAAADGPEQLWQALVQGQSLLGPMPAFRRTGAGEVPVAGFMPEAERFDAAFFGISPREAAAMDPTQRLFLTAAFQALAAAGLDRPDVAGRKVAVFAGAAGSGYLRTLTPSGTAADAYGLTGNLVSMTAARVAYFLDLKGPAITVDTACSSALVAVHLAVEALRRGEAEMALAGGVSLFLDEQPFQGMRRAGMLSATGRCRPFDEGADGIMVGEAVGCLVLEPLDRALAHGRPVLAVIRASGSNQDGRSNGITAPDAAAQAALIEDVLASADLDPASIDYVETHGTATRLGDPIEAAALARAYGSAGRRAPLHLGAAKGCVGHTSEAAGITGLVAAVMALRHRTLPPVPGFAELNIHVAAAADGRAAALLRVGSAALPWPAEPGRPRRAAVSAFGLSGTNAHLVLEEAPATTPVSAPVVMAGPGPGLRLWAGRSWAEDESPAVAEAEGELLACSLTQGQRLVADHRLAGRPVLHAALLLDFLGRAAARLGAGKEVAEIALLRPIEVGAAGCRIVVRRASDSERLELLADGAPAVTARIADSAPAEPSLLPLVDLEARLGPCRERATLAPATAAPEAGAVLGPSFPGFDSIRIAGDEALAELAGAPVAGDHVLPPRQGDAAIQAAVALLGAVELAHGAATPTARMPVRLGAFARIAAEAGSGSLRIHARRRGSGAPRRVETVDLAIADGSGRILHRLDGLVLMAVEASPAAEADRRPVARSWRIVWQEMPAARHGHDPLRPALILHDPASAGLASMLGRHYAAPVLGDAVDAERLVAAADGTLRDVWLVGGGAVGAETLLLLVRALARVGRERAPLTLRIVTRGACSTGEADPAPAPEQATLLGLAKAVSREMPAWRLRLVDLDPTGGEASDLLAARLLAEPGCPLGEPVAYRGRRRLLRRLAPLPAADSTSRPPLAAGDHVVIVGGMGRVGRAVAAGLAERMGLRLTLVGRSPLGGAQAETLAALRRAGATVSYRQADVGDPAALAAMLDQAVAEHGPVELLIQAVVDPVFGPVQHLAPAELRSALAPKVEGLRHLAALAATRPVGRLLVFSSIGAFTGFPGNEGQASYCAACCFEEAFAAAAAGPLPVQSIHWGLWSDPAFDPTLLARVVEAGTWPMPAGEAVTALLELLRSDQRNLVHASLSPAAWQRMGAPRGGEADPLAAAARTALETATAPGARADEQAAQALIEARIRAGLVAMLDASGWQQAEIWPAAGAAERLAVLPRHRRLASALLDMAQRRGLIERQSEGLRRVAVVAETVPAGEFTAPGLDAALGLLDPCLAGLPAVLAGEVAGTDLLFPGGSMARVEGIYRDQPLLSWCNDRVAAAVLAMARLRSAAEPLRVLEIGGGTGATSQAVLEALDAAGLTGRVRYLFTDISPAFVQQAKHRLGRDGLETRTFDVTKEPRAQGLEPAAQDVVIAANVLHATPDIHLTLGHVATLLAPGGVVLLDEMTARDDFATVTFGLLDGWWAVEDAETRLEHGPVLSVEGWQARLQALGLQGVAAAGIPSLVDPSSFAHAVIMASAPKRTARPAAPARREPPARPAAAPATASPPPAAAASGRDRQLAVEQELGRLIALALDLPAGTVDREQPLMEIGVDSLIAPQIIDDANQSLGTALRTTDLYAQGTVARLAQLVLDRHGAALRLPAAEPPPMEMPVAMEPAAVAAAVDTAPVATAIAVVGAAGRFPGALDLDQLWQLLRDGRHAISLIDRFALEPWLGARGEAGKTYAGWAGLLPEHDRFDPQFFGITPAEALIMDPQQRVLMEEAWKAIEDAGIDPASLAGRRCGFFVGASANNYQAPGAPSLRTLGGSMAILSARIAYALDLRGPTFPIDTGCSSSLVALHLACQSLRAGECDLALVAGVSVNLISPDILLYLADAGMASPTGRCHTFDDAADGFVPGEGVGVLVLKRQADALRDGDRIDALVRATAVNQDGRTAGLTAPSAEAQETLIADAHEHFGIDPETIGMVEAHGTGTRLGDPIEVDALTRAFRRRTERRGFTALGSIKTNVGHAMAAAGMAGLAKILLAFRHDQIPPSLHFERPNRHIDLKSSPFFVPTSAVPWPEAGPRRAAISSFGFSGTNAHAVLEAPPPAAPVASRPGPWLFAIAARDGAALQDRLRLLASWLRDHPDAALDRVAETLARGRAHGRYRRAVVAGGLEDLFRELERLVELPPPAPVARNHVASPIEVSADLEAVARAYERGDLPDWQALFGTRRPPLRLPAYPFRRERYWAMEAPAAAAPPAAAMTHPLLAAHAVAGRHLLPGTAMLELLRGPAPALVEATFAQPVQADSGPLAVEADDATGILRLVSGRGVLHAKGRRREVPGERPALPPAIGDGRVLETAALYEAFEAKGFAYGAPLRLIERVTIGASTASSVLGRPAALVALAIEHRRAALLDAALQTAAAIGLVAGQATSDQWVPAGIGALLAHGEIDRARQVVARLSAEPAADRLLFDLLLADADGTVLAELRKVEARRLGAPARPEPRLALYRPAWRELATTEQDALPTLVLLGEEAGDLAGWRQALAPASATFVDVTAGEAGLRQALQATRGPVLVLHLMPGLLVPPAATDEPATAAAALAALDPGPLLADTLAVLRAMITSLGSRRIRLLTPTIVADGMPPSPVIQALAGLYRTLRAEEPMLDARLVQVPAQAALVARIAAEARLTAGEALLRWDADGRRMAERWDEPVPAEPALAGPAADAVALITGGLGGIGLHLARHLAAQGIGRIALLGRRQPDAATAAALAAIEAEGAEILPLVADVADAPSLRAALRTVRTSFGPITQIYHLAGRLADGFLRDKATTDLTAVLAPKAKGAILLDRLTLDDPIERFVLFGSTASVLNVVGQGDYAAANGFLTGFAAWREQRCRAGARKGRTLAIAWPYWAEGGMRPAEAALAGMAAAGLAPLPTATGFEAMARLLAGDATAAMVLHGHAQPGDLAGTATRSAAGAAAPAGPVDAIGYVTAVLGEIAGLGAGRLDPDAALDELGIDSMMVMRVSSRMEADLGPLSKTLLFEYRTARALAEHLLLVKQGELARLAAGAVPPAAPTAPVIAPPHVESDARRPQPTDAADVAIAIVGMAGLFPGANDLDQFWANLAAGRDGIGEIPPERWPLEGFYDPDPANPATSHCRWGGFIDAADRFDARFFQIAPVEAETIDPQARKLLEVTWNALEDAALTPATLFAGLPPERAARRAVGVFVGVMYGDYQLLGPEEAAKGNLIGPNADYWNIANRLSAFFDWHGPSMAVDTACSSSLTAIHLACQALRSGDCDVAVAAGVNLCLHPRRHWILSKAGMVASDGRCHSFGAGGDGYVPGEGIASLILKPLARALADGDRIHGLVRGSAVNHGGRTNGYTQPSPVAQGLVIRDALEHAGVAPDSIGYVEAHGTGTPLGDPIEIRGLVRAFAERMPADLPIGSVKSNIGHLESAAGMAGVIKTLLQMRHGLLAPTLHAQPANPDLGIEGTGLRIVTAAEPWPARQDRPRRAGVSSFGAGGANAHVVLEEAPSRPEPAKAAEESDLVFRLSARTAGALRERALRLQAFLERERPELADVALTLATGRLAMPHRLAILARDHTGLVAALARFTAEGIGDERVIFVGEAKPGTPPAAGVDTASIAAAWVRGGAEAEATTRGRRIALPGYPFESRRLWVRTTPRTVSAIADFEPKTVQFEADEPLIADHVVAGEPALPGAALALALVEATGGGLADLHWRRLLRPNGAAIRLRLERDAGELRLVDQAGPACTARPAPPALPPDLDDAEALIGACDRMVARDAIYPALVAAGVAYGPAFQLLGEVRQGDGVAVAELLPSTLPAAILDAAFQLAFAVLPASLAGAALLPEGVAELRVTAPLTLARTVLARRTTVDGAGMRLDLWILDGEARAVATVSGLALRVVGAVATPTVAPTEPLRLLLPSWRPVPAEASAGAAPSRPQVLAWQADDPLAAMLAARWKVDVLPLEASSLSGNPDAVALVVGSIAGDDAAAADRLLEALRRLLGRLAQETAPPPILLLTTAAHPDLPLTATDAAAQPVAAAATAFLRAAAAERPAQALLCWDIPSEAMGDPAQATLGLEAALAAFAALDRRGEVVERGWRAGVTYRRQLLPLVGVDPAACLFEPGDVVLIAGAGGLGKLLAAEALARGARVALLGRRATPAPGLRELVTGSAGRCLYLAADLTQREPLRDAIERAQRQLGPVTLAFHTALVMGDAMVADLPAETLAKVLAAKTHGFAALAAALRTAPLRTMVVFSSSNALTANPGQAAYAAASAFLDAAALRPDLPWPVRVVDWGFWGESGRVADEAHRRTLARVGVLPIADREGIQALAGILAAPLGRVAVLRVAEPLLAPLGVAEDESVAPAAGAGLSAAAASAAAGALRQAQASTAFAAPSLDELNRLVAERLHLRLWQQAPAASDLAGLAQAIGLVPGYRPAWAALADLLGRAGLVDTSGRPTAAAAGLDSATTLALCRALAERVPSTGPMLRLLDACLDGLVDVLAGRRDAASVLFPNGSSELVQPIYRGNPIVDFFQRMLASAVQAAVQGQAAARPEAPLTILEVGAGTGGTTGFVLDALDDEPAALRQRLRYRISDIAAALVESAGRTLAQGRPHVDTLRLDIEAPLPAQGVAAGSVDMVIAANVLHATRDLVATLGRLREALRPGGLLILNEATSRQDINTLTFGLTPGWWAFADALRRLPHGPLLDLPRWRLVLAEAGFETVAAAGLPLEGGGEDGIQTVLIARAGPLLRQKSASAAPVVAAAAPVRAVAATAAAGDALHEQLRRLVADVLHLELDEVTMDGSFSDLGADSILSVELVRRLNEAFRIELKTTTLFNYATIRELARYLAAEHGVGGKAPDDEAGAADRRLAEGRGRTRGLRELIDRRLASAPVNREAEFWQRQGSPAPEPPPAPEPEADLAALLRALEQGTIGVDEALARKLADV